MTVSRKQLLCKRLKLNEEEQAQYDKLDKLIEKKLDEEYHCEPQDTIIVFFHDLPEDCRDLGWDSKVMLKLYHDYRHPEMDWHVELEYDYIAFTQPGV